MASVPIKRKGGVNHIKEIINVLFWITSCRNFFKKRNETTFDFSLSSTVKSFSLCHFNWFLVHLGHTAKTQMTRSR